MDLWSILAWLVFGGLAGWVASVVVGKDSQLGVVGNIIVGIIGAFIGGALFPNDADTFDFGSFVAAVIGAIILLLIVSAFTRNKNPRI